MKTSKEYKESLRKMRPNIYKFGELITDVTTNPATKRSIEGHAQIFDAAQKPEFKDILTTTSHFTGEPISRYLSIVQGPRGYDCKCPHETTHVQPHRHLHRRPLCRV